jgi:Immunity protein 49
MKSVSRHEISQKHFLLENLEKFKKYVPIYLKTLETKPEVIVGTGLSELQKILATAVAAEIEISKQLEYLQLMHQFSLMNFRVGAGSDSFEIEVLGKAYHIAPHPKTDFMSVDYWKLAFDFCMITRDMDGLRFLANVPEATFVKSNHGAQEFDLAYFRLLSHFFTGGKHTGSLLIAAMEAADKPQSNSARDSFVELVRYPELEMLEAFVKGDANSFNEQLYGALLGHKKYYGSKENAMAAQGWIAEPPIALCAMAVDAKQFHIEVESDYLPQWMVSGEGITK